MSTLDNETRNKVDSIVPIYMARLQAHEGKPTYITQVLDRDLRLLIGALALSLVSDYDGMAPYERELWERHDRISDGINAVSHIDATSLPSFRTLLEDMKDARQVVMHQIENWNN